MRRPLRLLLPLGLICLLAFSLAACGGDDGDKVPDNAVAKVGDVAITKDQFTHWMSVAAASTAAQSGATGEAAKAPVPPDYTACIAAKKKAAAKPAKGQPTVTDAQYKTQCQQTYEQLRDSVVQFLITSVWFDQEAANLKVSVTDAKAEAELKKAVKQQFPKDADYQKYLKTQGITNADLVFQEKLSLLQTALQKAVTKGKDTVTDAQISTYYNGHKSTYATPETRDVSIVLTKTKAEAEAAKKALDSGQSWKAVAKKYSIDDASKNTAGKLTGIAKGQQEKALDSALFGAKKGVIGGPVKTQFGYYVYEVDKITAANQQTLAQAKASIKQTLVAAAQQKALTNWSKTFQKEYTAKTNCATDYAVQYCKNAPKTTTTATTATAAAAAADTTAAPATTTTTP
jgi:foldase protein PrsA